MRVAVLGASGFVGTEVYRTLTAAGGFEVVPFARSTGNSWELLRLGIAPVRLDLMDAGAAEAALRGFEGVVNCSRPAGAEAIPATRAMLAAVTRAGVRRFVHISSVAIYGDRPRAAAVGEGATPSPTTNYGRMKLLQDTMVARASGSGLSAVTLCPPNITGPGSAWLLDLLTEFARGAVPLVNGGTAVLSTVDVGNLAHACARALVAGPTDGRRLFVTDPGAATWRDAWAVARALVPSTPEPRAIDADELERLRAGAAEREPSFSRAMARLASGELRQVLAAEPWWQARLGDAKKLVLGLPAAVAEPLKSRLSSPASVVRRSPWAGIKAGLVAQQLRGVRHASAAAETAIGYRPPYDWDASMAAFGRWHAFTHPPAFAEGLAA